MIYEILDDQGNVTNTIVATSEFIAEYYANNSRLVGPEPMPQTWIISKLAMISRFTNAEYVGILSAKKSDVTVEAWYDAFSSANEINLQDQRTIDGVNFLVIKNLLTQDRANVILYTSVEGEYLPPPAIKEIAA